jgi:hypothetical protein
MNHHTMTDDELATAVRESVTTVHMTIPAEQIAARGGTIRTRRRVPLLTGALAGAAGAALAVSALLPPGHQARQPFHAQLAAWTVVNEPNGDIQVTVREWRDAEGLQRTLRADGLPVNVSATFPSLTKLGDPGIPLNSSCQQFPGGTIDQLNSVVDSPSDQTIESHTDQSAVLVIHPSALPDGAGLFIYGPGLHVSPQDDDLLPIGVALAKASPECTGS